MEDPHRAQAGNEEEIPAHTAARVQLSPALWQRHPQSWSGKRTQRSTDGET